MLSNEKMKDIFDDFVNEIEMRENNSLDDVVEAFANVQDRFTELSNTAINKHELYQLRNDFRILQETFEEVIDDMDVTEEGKDCVGKECGRLDKKNLDIVNDNDEEVAKDAKKQPKQNRAEQKANGDVIDTTFDQEALRGKNKKPVKEDFDDFEDDLEIEEFDPELDVTTEAAGPGLKFYIKNYGTLYMNALKSSKDINNIQPGLMKIVKRCKTMREIEYLQKDANHSVSILKSHMKNFGDNKKKVDQFKQHIEWINSTYKPAIKAKKAEIEQKEKNKGNKKKVVKECIIQILEGCVSTIDGKIQMHGNADEFARNTVLENYMGENVLIPIIKKSDMQLDGLKLAYKMKHVLESLTVLVSEYEGADNTALIKNAVESNKNNAKFVLESFKGIPSTPVYKVNFFNTFNDLLQIVDENVNELCALYENFDIKEIDYDDVNGDLLIDDENNAFRILTECVDDNPINGDVECIDMDFILANTIMEYTLLETMHTLQLEEFKYNDIKKITNNMLNK